MDSLAQIPMEWTQLSIFLIGIFCLFIWDRTESRNDWQHTDDFIKAIQEDMKDFHTRLSLQNQEFKMRMCTIEERNKK
jgi:hypothetical protein